MSGTLVVPCYNEATRLDGAAFAKALEERSDTSFVFVNDGSTDDTSSAEHSNYKRPFRFTPNAT